MFFWDQSDLILKSTIFILHNHQKRDGNVTCLVLLVMRKIKEILAARRRKKAA